MKGGGLTWKKMDRKEAKWNKTRSGVEEDGMEEESVRLKWEWSFEIERDKQEKVEVE